MIKQISIANFKCFTEIQTFRLGKLTLFAGLNSAGKSSALQPILLLAQALRFKPNPRAIPLNGALVKLGSAGEVVPIDESRSSIEVCIQVPSGSITWELGARAGQRFLYRQGHAGDPLARDPVEWPLIEESGLTKLTYLAASRYPANAAHPFYESTQDFPDVGRDGRFAAHWYNERADDEVDLSRRHPDEPAATLRKQVDAWLSSLFGTAQVNVQSVAQLSMFGVQVRMSSTGAWVKPANVGFGLSYAFPVVVALLTATLDQIIIIDDPEAHLHPRAQSQMGRLLAKFAAAGVQVVVETHSDHVLNGARVAVKDRLIDSSDLSLIFVRRSESRSIIEEVPLNPDGRIPRWPHGFFDQIETDLARL